MKERGEALSQITKENADDWGEAPGKKEYEILHNFYIYDNQNEKGYKIKGPVMQFEEERLISNIKELDGGYIEYDQTQTFKQIAINMTDEDTYEIINYGAAHYLYEVSHSPKWLLASQALSMTYREFSTWYFDKIVFKSYIYD